MEYPKIETLFNRKTEGRKKGHVIEGEFRLKEFTMIDEWYSTEKIHGTNTRVEINPGSLSRPRFKGRTANSQIPAVLVEYLQNTFHYDSVSRTFPDFVDATEGQITLYGEGYGAKIQEGGNYRKDASFRLFDVFVADEEHPMGGWWLEPENVTDIADKLEISTAPVLGIMQTDEIIEVVKSKPTSLVSFIDDGNEDYIMEGVVARTKPLLFTRRGRRLMWKLKARDFPEVTK